MVMMVMVMMMKYVNVRCLMTILIRLGKGRLRWQRLVEGRRRRRRLLLRGKGWIVIMMKRMVMMVRMMKKVMMMKMAMMVMMMMAMMMKMRRKEGIWRLRRSFVILNLRNFKFFILLLIIISVFQATD